MRNLMIAFLVAFVAFVAVPAAEAEPQQRSLLNVPCDVEIYIHRHHFSFDDEYVLVFIDWAADFNDDEIDSGEYDVMWEYTVIFRGEYRERNDDGEYGEWEELDHLTRNQDVGLYALMLKEEWETFERYNVRFANKGLVTVTGYHYGEASEGGLQIRNAELDDIVLNGDVRCRRR